MSDLGKLLIIVGAITVVIGIVFTLGPRIPWLGKLPGDIAIDRGNVHVYIPIVTCLVVSVVATIILNLFFRR